ncbi:MAG: nucleotidyltransferase family protein [Sulfuricellaceae bacterium]|jgi:dTDP-glucose pyrophosphorylase
MKRWEPLLVSPETTIAEAVKVIDAGSARITLVVDSERRLLGTVTDGDVRRGIIHQIPLSDPVVRIMNSKPTVLQEGTDPEKVMALFLNNDLLQIPVVDGDGRLVGLESYRELLSASQRENWVFLMAGGFGKRLRPLTDDCPKPMLNLGGKPILEGIIERFIASGFHKFYISVHYLADQIKNYFGDGQRFGATIRYIEENAPLGTAGALGLLPEVGELPLIVMNGDLLTQLDFAELLRYHEKKEADLTVCVREYDYQVPFGVVTAQGERVVDVIEKPVHTFFVNAGIYVLSPGAIRGLQPEVPCNMPDLIRERIKEGRQVAMFPIHEYWLDVGRMDDFERAQLEFCVKGS